MKTNLLKTFLLATVMVGSSAWAYEVPEGYEIKNVYLGTLSTDGISVTAEDFENMTELGSAWQNVSANSISLGSVEEVANVEVGSTVETVPTYVSGKTVHVDYKNTSASWVEGLASYTLTDVVSTGKLVFSADLYLSGYASTPIIVRFADSDGNNVLTLNFKNGSNNQYFQYTVGSNSAANTKALSTFRTYRGYEIKDLVIDFATGDASFTIDFINSSKVRAQETVTLNIGTGKNIAKLLIGRQSSQKSETDVELDNVQLYTVSTASGTYNYTVNAVVGETTIKQLAAGSCKGGTAYSVTGLPKVIESDGKFYVLSDESVSSYAKSFTMGEADETQTVSYKEDANIVYFNDADGATWPSSESVSGASGGNTGSWGNKANIASISDLAQGVYDVTLYVWSKGGNGKNHRGEVILNGEEETAVSGNTNGERTYQIFVKTGNTVQIYGAGSNKATDVIDYVMITKVAADIPTISSAGVATYAPTMNVAVPEGVEAYAVTVADSKVTATKIESESGVVLEKGKGYLLKAEAGDYAFVGSSAEATTVEANDLKAATEAVTADGKQYVLASKTSGVGFYKMKEGVTIPAGKAYLEVSGDSNAKEFFSLFDDGGTTAISSVAAESRAEAFYTLQGVKTTKPQKGLYIVNGKKVIKK